MFPFEKLFHLQIDLLLKKVKQITKHMLKRDKHVSRVCFSKQLRIVSCKEKPMKSFRSKAITLYLSAPALYD